MKLFFSFAIAGAIFVACSQEATTQADADEILDLAALLNEDSLGNAFTSSIAASSAEEPSSSQEENLSSDSENSSSEEVSSETELSSVEFGTSSEEASSEEASSEEPASSSEEPSSSSEAVVVSSSQTSGCYPSDCVADQPKSQWGDKLSWPVGTQCSYQNNNYTSKTTWPQLPPSSANAAGNAWDPWTDDGAC